MSQEVEADILGDEWKGYVLKITGGNDKQGFPMKQGVLLNHRTRLLLSKGHSCYRPRRDGERKRKSVRGCIVGPDLSVLSVIIVKTGEQPLPGLTDKVIPRRLGPKRASKIRKLFNLTKEDNVHDYVIRRKVIPKKEGKKPYFKSPKIQRLITPAVLHRRRRLQTIKVAKLAKSKVAAKEYAELLAIRNKEKEESRKQAKDLPKNNGEKRRMSGQKLTK